MSSNDVHEPDDRPDAVQRAETGAQAWRAVVHAQQVAKPNHTDFYDLAGYLVDTLASMEALARTLVPQVGRYADGRAVYDDTHTVDPGERLHDATLDLGHLAEAVAYAARDVNRFWSAIGHIGVECGEGSR
ncbi:hypothetical protein [Pseudonocardia sp. 73-21]|uniref:hypothetical protein n=1 Tax=Pseudonocardia sp. 73-21 TaxID=1895809 RepID=UPI000965B3F8|nr:hypothetical protein [Pseudonocardia sp. 73-21]OJY47508.1 MAG: hypothetical protein BGP03_32705 [Pseudonocardia sp. 73-21]